MESRVRASEWIIESSDSPQPAAALGWEARIAPASLADDGDRVQAHSSAGVRWSSAAAWSRDCSAEIGRDSGGERVCQYVSIPVVAVSFKTKPAVLRWSKPHLL